MSITRRSPGGVTLTLSLMEVLVLNGAVIDLAQLVAEPEAIAESLDPLDAWEREFAEPDHDVERDAEWRRLFPNAYPEDAQASDEFRRYTESAQRQDKARDAALVSGGLSAALDEIVGDFTGPTERLIAERGEQTADVEITDADVDAWLKTLTAVRLRFGVQLGLDTQDDVDRIEELPDDDPVRVQASIFDWLGYVQESILDALM